MPPIDEHGATKATNSHRFYAFFLCCDFCLLVFGRKPSILLLREMKYDQIQSGSFITSYHRFCHQANKD